MARQGPTQARRLAVGGLVAVAIAIVVLFALNSSYGIIAGQTHAYDHHIQAIVPSAFGVIPGERVVAGGVTVGEITKAEVTKDGKARVVMGIKDEQWPVPTDSVLTLRMGGTIKRTDRFVSIAEGRSKQSFADDGIVPAKQFVVPVEYGSLFDIFDAPTRTNLRQFFAKSGPTFNRAADPFNRALGVAPPVVENAAAVFRDLTYNEQALRTLVSSSGQVTKAIARSNPGLRTLLTSAADTFGTVSDQTAGIRRILDAGEATMRIVGTNLHHTGRTLPELGKLTDRLEPALTELDRLASPLNATLRGVVRVAPNGVETFRTIRRAGPDLNRLLTSAREKLMTPLAPVADKAATQLNCIRPFTPDIMNFLQGWGGFFAQGFDKPNTSSLHTLVSLLPFPNQVPVGSDTIKQAFPNLRIENPHVPGEGWGQPWFLPECGYTPEGLIAKNDPEIGTFDPQGSKAVPYEMR